VTHHTAFTTGDPGPHEGHSGQISISDSMVVTAESALSLRLLRLLGAVAAGGAVGLLLADSVGSQAILPVLCALAFLGGLLSTWSPCGYSSLSLLRPTQPYGARSVAAWLPTLGAHALGYLAGGLVLGGAVGLLGWLLPVQAFKQWWVPGVGVLGLAFALHQLRLIRMPYPQRPSQVPHRARLRLPMWQTGLLYGWLLGLNFTTYVRTPILFLVVLAALFSASIGSVLLLLLSLNLGRFLPMLVNFLPLNDWAVQRWLANNERNAVEIDAVILGLSGTVLLFLGLA
jgi:hypothetical protein